MDAVLRLIMRIILVPIGYVAAIAAATAVITVAAWRGGDLATAAAGVDEPFAAMGLFIGVSVLFTVLLTTMWLPASVGVLLSESFAIRSWMFHAASGAASAWLGWTLFPGVDEMRAEMHLSNGQPVVTVVAAGLAGGFVYWAIAGWSAGFWKPVYRAPAGAVSPPQSAATFRS
jgi:hypothetical protein